MKNKLTLSLDLRIVCILLAVIILTMLALWRPWQADATSERKISVTGTGKVTSAPDSYQFNPSYQRATQEELNTDVTAVTSKLKELGVKEKDIQLSGSSYGNPRPLSEKTMIAPAPDMQTNYASLTIKVSDKELAQKVQDYIATTNAQGQLTPNPTYSDEKQKQLKEEARDKAIADAKAQAERLAKNLGARLGKVIEVSDDKGMSIMPYQGRASLDSAEQSANDSSLPIFTGEQDTVATVEVTYEIK